MATIITGNSVLFAIVCFIATFKGLDLKERSSWLCGLYGFLSGFLLGFLGREDTTTNLLVGIQVGIVFAGIVLIGGATTRRNRRLGERYEALAQENLQEKLDNLAEALFNDETNRK